MLSLSEKKKKATINLDLKKKKHNHFRTMEYHNLRIYASKTVELQVRILEILASLLP